MWNWWAGGGLPNEKLGAPSNRSTQKKASTVKITALLSGSNGLLSLDVADFLKTVEDALRTLDAIYSVGPCFLLWAVLI